MCRNIRCDVFFVFTEFTGPDLNSAQISPLSTNRAPTSLRACPLFRSVLLYFASLKYGTALANSLTVIISDHSAEY